MARAQIDASSPVVRRGGDSAMGRGDPVLPGLILAARRERWREIPTGTRSFPPFILPSHSQIHCRSLVLPGGTMGSENQQSAAAARELLVASTARQRKDIAARARAQKLGTSSMVMAAHGRKAATAAQERGRPPVEKKFSGRSLAGNPSFGAPPPPPPPPPPPNQDRPAAVCFRRTQGPMAACLRQPQPDFVDHGAASITVSTMDSWRSQRMILGS
ncbi:hypothetical protein PVAP13_2KG534530 [Panicum virgatum]|uniref:Uncharacterized protein n=1 Tax=Panicum virgatum TaxID=38727 RepID=A0A8T0WIF4_PANVG|nr:hypothetical protein PVAP13_2KG534530 [Panicum virgatum]